MTNIKKLNAIFIGCANISAACLEELIQQDNVKVSAAFTVDSKTITKRQISDVGNIATLAKKAGAELNDISPEKINEQQYIDKIRSLHPDVLFCIGWPTLIRNEILGIPKYRFGMHISKLPENRGQAPIPWAILRGMTSSAVTCFELEEKADAGQIYFQEEFPILPDDTSTTIYQEHYVPLGRQIIRKLVPNITSGSLRGTLQDNSKATYTRKRIPSDGLIDWSWPTAQIYSYVRALTHPYYPGAFTHISSEQLKELKIWKARQFEPRDKYFGVPGQVVGIEDDYPIIRTGDGALLLKEVGTSKQNIVSANEFEFKLNQRLGIGPVDLMRQFLHRD